MKIALLCSNSGSGGLIKYIKGFLNTPTSHEIRLYCGKSIPIPESKYVEIIKTEYSEEDGLDLLFTRPLNPKLIELVSEFNPDVVIFLNGYMRKGLEKYPSISILHNELLIRPDLILRQRPLRLVVSLLAARRAVLYTFKNVTGMIFLSQSSQIEADKLGYKYKDGRTILFGQDKRIFIKVDDSNKNEMIYVSTQFPYKNHKKLIKALGLVKKSGADFHVNFVGCKETPYLKKLVKSKKLEENVKFCGWLSYEETTSLITRAKYYLHASVIESTSNGVLEGVNENCTIVCSNIGVFSEALKDKAYYFNPNNVKDMANKIIQAINKPINLSLSDCNEIFKPYDYEDGVKKVYEYAEYIYRTFKK